MRRPLKLRELTAYLAGVIQTDPILNSLSVEGEVANLRAGRYVYFDLRDENDLLHCVWFQPISSLPFHNGDSLIVTGNIGIYGKGSVYQLRVRGVEPVGLGAQLVRLEALKRRLAAEGIFDRSKKPPIPRFPRGIGLITSSSGAVLHDFGNEIAGRYPRARIWLAPASVQGTEAAHEIIAAIDAFHRIRLEKMIDVIVIARGGGSDVHLEVFQDEELVRAIAGSQIPIVTAIGHQVDTSLADLASSQRASTPTEAAILVTPDREELHQQIDDSLLRIRTGILLKISKYRLDLSRKISRIEELRPENVLDKNRQRLNLAVRKVQDEMQCILSGHRRQVDALFHQILSLRDQFHEDTSWQMSDLDGKIQSESQLEIGKRYLLKSRHYQYQIVIETKGRNQDGRSEI
ncbi:MAG: exodeoxyribonuclease VII large subunit [Peptoniphilaceae bacterium]|nr:exodeoxyribonuclease VII large subunit [Peptoniphilaceae bacterium]